MTPKGNREGLTLELNEPVCRPAQGPYDIQNVSFYETFL